MMLSILAREGTQITRDKKKFIAKPQAVSQKYGNRMHKIIFNVPMLNHKKRREYGLRSNQKKKTKRKHESRLVCVWINREIFTRRNLFTSLKK